MEMTTSYIFKHGTAFGNYENEGEFRQIIAEADNNMYQVKAKRKKNSI